MHSYNYLEIMEAVGTNARADIAGLSVFTNIRRHSLLRAFTELLEAALEAREALTNGYRAGTAKGKTKTPGDNAVPAVQLFSRWAAFIEQCVANLQNYSWYEYLAFLALTDDNIFTRSAEFGQAPPPLLRQAAALDLERLGRIAVFDTAKLGFAIAEILKAGGLYHAAKSVEAEARLLWTEEGNTAHRSVQDIFPPNTDWGAALPRCAEYIRQHGAGEMGLHHFFYWQGTHSRPLQPVRNPDTIQLDALSGYESQRSIVVANTARLAAGKGANNLLLHGDRGTGKSATVKAVCNEFADKGLRLLEVRKNDLFDLPRILDTLAARALFFVIFIDDLSFEAIDDSFTCLKAILEGGVEQRPGNVAIYATSNRRHLVKEKISDRPGLSQAADLDGEVRAFETMQEQFSLADRFGLSLVFTTPTQEEYLNIAEHIARRRAVLPSLCDIDTFRQNALRWEKWFNGRSPRTAVQYVDWLCGGAGFPWE